MPNSTTGRESPWALLAVLAVVAIGMVVVSLGHWRRGSVLIASALGLAATLRLVLPTALAGLLVVRKRWTDVITLVSFAVTITILAMTR